MGPRFTDLTFFILLLAVMWFSVTAYAAETSDDVGGDPKDGPGPTVVQLPVVLMPMTNTSDDLMYYSYAVIELEIPTATDRWAVEDAIHVIKDTFVRELHEQPNYHPDRPGILDVEGIRTRLFARVNEIFPDGRVGSVIFRDIATPK